MPSKDKTPDEALHDLGDALAEALHLEQVVVWLGKRLTRLKCKLGWHEWDMYAGFYEERVAKGAHCLECGACYDC